MLIGWEEYNYFINCTAVQLTIFPKQTKWRKGILNGVGYIASLRVASLRIASLRVASLRWGFIASKTLTYV
jgi:hypothetical protein